MITDPQPRVAHKRGEYDKSDALVTMPLPPAAPVQDAVRRLAEVMAGGELAPVRRVGDEILGMLAAFYRVPPPPLRVLGVRPHKVVAGVCTYQLFGDYTPSTQRIRVWMRTAIRGQVSSPKALLNTLLHEFCHHLDCTRLGWRESFHTRGFFTRIDHLYHLALATAPEARRRLQWVKRGSVWAIDWQRSRARGRGFAPPAGPPPTRAVPGSARPASLRRAEPASDPTSQPGGVNHFTDRQASRQDLE